MTQDDRDRISSLPDDVICHILSFLPTKYSFRTTLLSSRWKHLFAYVPVLDFDFLALTTTTTTIYDTPRHSRFIDFVNRLLKLNKLPRMTKFRLNCDASQFPELDNFLVSWILSAHFHNVGELNIVIYNDFTIIPDELFSCEMLSTLKLQGNFWRELPASACLPCLKTLHLRCVIFGFSFERLLSVFPVLEDLLFDSCILQNADISHPTLVKFSFDDCYVNELVFNVPSLLCFDYLNSTTDAILGEVVLTSLIKARICCEGYILTKIVSVVSHAKHLYLSTISIEDFQDSCPALPTFHNLTHLEVGEVTRVVLGLLPDLLNRSSHLEVLVFAEGFSREESDDSELVCFENVPSCVSRNLKEIEFRKFTMKEIECKLLEYSLRNAQVLVKMKIQSHMSWKEKYEFRKKLRTFPKFSSDCQIKIDSEYLMGR